MCPGTNTLWRILLPDAVTQVMWSIHRGCLLTHTRRHGKLFNVARLRAKTKVRRVLIKEILFADDAALATHTEDDLQQLMDRLSHACKEFGLTISIKNTNVKGQDVVMSPSVNNVTLDVVDSFTYLGSTITNKMSLDAEISIRIAKAAAIMSKLNRKVWSNNNLTESTKLHVYQECVLAHCCTVVRPGQHMQDKRRN